MMLFTQLVAATLWTCAARSTLGMLYVGSAATRLEAKAAALNACHAHHPMCVVTKCVQQQ
jgi:hypothetical protein